MIITSNIYLNIKATAIKIFILLLIFAASSNLAASNCSKKSDSSTVLSYQAWIGSDFSQNNDKLSLSEKRVIGYIERNWLFLEEDLTFGGGNTLQRLNLLAKCQFILTDKYWEKSIKGLPNFKSRQQTFIKDYWQACLC